MQRANNIVQKILPILLSSSLLVVLGIALPLSVHAATAESAKIITVSSSTPDNAYYAASQVTVNAILPADLSAIAGNITVDAPVGGDALLAGGTVNVRQPVGGDARIIGGKVNVENNVGGDLVVAGGFVTDSGSAADARIAGITVQLSNGARGPVTIYGADVSLGGEFDGDVEVVASDHIDIAPGTIIHGTLKYNAPEQLAVPSSAVIDNGVDYIGQAAFLPTIQEAKTFAVAGLWIFFIVRLIAGLVAVGLIVGLFPQLTRIVVEGSFTRSSERMILIFLLGLGSLILFPMLILLLAVSFVGIGLALLLGAAYFLYIVLAYIYANVLAGALVLHFVRRLQGRGKSWQITWRGSLLGVIVLYAFGFIPIIGILPKIVFTALAGGVMLLSVYRFAFKKEDIDFMDL